MHEIAGRLLGSTLVRSRPNSSRCLLPYRAVEGCPGKLILAGAVGQIEVLGRGQQFVADGTHPSGVAFRWSPAALATVARECLPAVSEEQIALFLKAASALIEAREPRRSRQRARRVMIADPGALASLVRLVAGAREGSRNSLSPRWRLTIIADYARTRISEQDIRIIR